MSISNIRIFAAVSACLLLSPFASAAGLCDRCGGTGKCQSTKEVTTTETQIVTETCYREEQVAKTVMVNRTISVAQEVPYEYTAWVRVKKEDPQEIEIKTPKFRWVDQKYTETVPGIDTVTKFKKRCDEVPVVKTCTVTEDHGCWETKMVPSETCNGCLCCEKKVWCPNLVEVTVEKVVMEKVEVEEPYVCQVPIMVPIEKTRRVKEYFTKIEKQTVKNPYTTLEPRKRTKMVTAFVPETVCEEKIEWCTVKVPYTVEKEVEVCVTRTVPCDVVCDCCAE